ncbi:hypothetical protein OV079_07095 [Nannocystis pusilla]|uniref:Uncharacterized protein n=1 Tax=Nannocystis pusilla TaxID=889268 RepID=A0A9X3EKI2_9BACT|nr:hypothetical protein [Nannocystis pusilla]MCY1005341.1 hypothetical protein [Nannocystis pusilla]
MGPLAVAACLCAACPGDSGDTTDTAAGTDPTTDSGPTTGAPTGVATDDPAPTSSTTSEPPDTTDGPVPDPTDGPVTTTTNTTDETETGDTTTGGQTVNVVVHLIPQEGVTGEQRINFAVPLAPGVLADDTQVQVHHAGTELATALRGLARHPDGSWRSVQIQLDLAIDGETDLDVALNAAPAAGSVNLVPVADTLVDTGPNVWALLPAEWLTTSRFAGPLGTAAAAEGTPGQAWSDKCDYDEWNVEAFLGANDSADVWLYDRGTTHWRGHARRGDLSTLRSAYLETTIYRDGLSGQGPDTAIGVPGKTGDAKYYYTQNMALHYLMTGDDRFRESAEDVAEAFADLWDPVYEGGASFWTERHAGFGLLAYVWAMNVSDDQAQQFRDLADAAVTAYLDVQASYPPGYDDPDARCFAHTDVAADEEFGFWGCSPWLSAILADGLDQYATESPGAQADAARASIVKLGRVIARDGLDPDGKPFYWMGVGDGNGAVDDYDEHWGESAYVVAMAYYHDGAADPELRQTAEDLVAGFGDLGEVPHMRSFNWQCRSAVATPWFLAQ